MAIETLYPAIRPSLDLNFAGSKTLDPRITFSRASAATYYDGKTVAKAEENLFTYSQDLENGIWAKGESAVTANTDVAPDGTVTADSLTAAATVFTAGARVMQGKSSLPAGTYTFSVWLKRKTGTGGVSLGMSTADTPGNTVALSLSEAWQRFSLTVTVSNPSLFSPRIILAAANDSVAVWGAQLEQRSSATAYTPTTSQPITNYIPVLQTAPAGVPRFDHNPLTGESLGLLVEEQRTNLFLYSEQFDNAFWLKTNALIGQNVAVAPDGTLTGDKLTENSVNGQHAVSGNVNAVAGTYTLSVYLKAADRTWAAVSIYDIGAGTSYRTFFNLSTGTIGTNAAGNTPTITPVGNGWFRCSVSRAITGGGTGSHSIFVCTGDNALSYQGDGYSGLYIWGAQFGDGAYATSYIKSEASQATRSADSQSISNMGRVGAGTIYIDATVRSGATLSTSGSTTFAATASTRQKTAVAYDAASTRKSINGAAVTSSAGTQGGSNISIAPGATGWISKLSIYPQKISDTNLQSLTA